MKKLSGAFMLMLLLYFAALPAKAQEHSTQQHTTTDHKMINADELEWKEGPAILPAGARFAVLEGDPAKEGAFTLRIKFPPNYKVPPHWHSKTEHITVLEGNFYMSAGQKPDPSAATKIAVGGFAIMPAKTPHMAYTKEVTVVQLHGIGPFDINYLNPADDPRAKTAKQ